MISSCDSCLICLEMYCLAWMASSLMVKHWLNYQQQLLCSN